MNVVGEDDIIDQSDYEEFEGVPDRSLKEVEEEEVGSATPKAVPEPISPNWQLSAEHTFVPEHFCKVTACEYCGHTIVSWRWHQGLRCKECAFDVHFDCAPLAQKNCLSLHDTAPLRPDLLQPHTFYEKHFPTATFCNVCRKMLYGLGKQGWACAACQFVSHEECLAKAPVNCPPQKLDAPLSEPLRHYWIEGNLTDDCVVCRESLSKFTILYGFRCSYCTVKVCPKCLPQVQHAACDEGPFASLKFGPGDIITNASDVPAHWHVKVPENRRPLIVFINKKSGGQVGKLIAQRLSRVLNPTQIIDLSQGGPMPMLRIMQDTKSPYRVLACGGDGTAAWLLSALDKLEEEGHKYLPPVAVLPLGTGNDLARVLGWGGGYDNEAMPPICSNIDRGHEIMLDRWKLEIENVDVENGVKHPKVMNNYFSIGVDAKIALDFHRKREANPAQFKSRGMNKVIYFGLGTSAIFEGGKNLTQILQIELDGNPITLPPTCEGVMVLNLASWAGGTNAWGSKVFPPWLPQSPCDGAFELLAVTGSFHLGQIQGKLTDGIRLGQGKDVKFTWLTNDVLPVQLDGEPWEEGKSVIRLSFFKQSRLIASAEEKDVWKQEEWLQPESFVPGTAAPSSASVPVAAPSGSPDQIVEIDPNASSSGNTASSPGKKHKKKHKKTENQERKDDDAPKPLLIDIDDTLSSDPVVEGSSKSKPEAHVALEEAEAPKEVKEANAPTGDDAPPRKAAHVRKSSSSASNPEQHTSTPLLVEEVPHSQSQASPASERLEDKVPLDISS